MFVMNPTNHHLAPTSQSPRRTIPPDARVIKPEDQPQSYAMIARPAPPSPPRYAAPIQTSSSFPAMVIGELFGTILPALFIAVLIHLFLAQSTRVEGYSMEPTLHGRQRVIIEKISYRFHPPRRDDIVVIRKDGFPEMLIKRVIALPGEKVEVRDGKVWINDTPLEEQLLAAQMRGRYPPTIVPEGMVSLMGDNRNNSNDSRSFGPVSLDNIVGRAWLRYWPLSEFGLVH